MFISNIISKLLAIIYKPGIIYKATTTPINKDQHPRSTNINIGSIEPFYTMVIYNWLTRISNIYPEFTLIESFNQLKQ